MNDGGTAHGLKTEVRDTFFRILVEDVLSARQRQREVDTQASRRDLIRSTFAAIECSVSEYRAHVLSFVKFLETSTPMIDAALTATSYTVSPTGKLTAQSRHIALPAAFRLATRLAEQNCTDLKVNFDHGGWKHLQQAIDIRNRVTHPKRTSDLEITSDDITVSESGFFWVFQTILKVMEATTAQMREHVDNFRVIFAALELGDPVTLAHYERAMAALDTDPDSAV